MVLWDYWNIVDYTVFWNETDLILQLCSLIQMAAMFQDKYVFSQLTAFLNRTQFNNYVRKYDGNHYVKQFTCWNQMLAMMFGQLSNCESLRDLIVAFEVHRDKQYHLGLGREPIPKTTLATANHIWWRKPVRSGRPTSLTFLERNMRLIQQRFRCV